MKKLVFLGSAITALLTPIIVLAQTPSPLSIQIGEPAKGFKSISNAISNLITIALAVAIILVLVMLILGAYEWITSGGDKEAVAKARNRIINALIGLVVLAVAFALARLGGQITGLDIGNLIIPTPATSVPSGQI